MTSQFDQFFDLIRARLEQGAKDYGKVEQTGGDPRNMDDLLAEIEQEIMDIVGWSGVAWLKLQSMKAKAGCLLDRAKASKPHPEDDGS